MTSAFTYHILQGDEIRVLQVKPDDSNVMECQIQHVSLSHRPRFWALSYFWGTAEDPQTIRLNGSSFEVTQNLYAALLQYRRLLIEQGTGGEILLGSVIWIDAICINQKDPAEKSLQVPRMSAIYSRCDRVLAWLGPVEIEEKASVDDMVAQLHRFETTAKSEGTEPPDVIKDFIQHADQVRLDELGNALRSIGNRPWFSRIWVAQEVALADQSPVVLLGPHTLDYWILLGSWACILSPDLTSRLPGTYCTAPTMSYVHIQNQYKQTSSNSSPDASSKEEACASRLLSLLDEAFTLGATVPHDHIYGLLGLVDTSSLPSSLQPDYDQSFELVFLSYTRFLLMKTADIRVLDLGPVGKLGSVPSWVPDLRRRTEAKINLRPKPLIQMGISSDGQELCVPAIVLGRVVCKFDAQPKRSDANPLHLPRVYREFGREIILASSRIKRISPDESLVQYLRAILWSLFGEKLQPHMMEVFAWAYKAYASEHELDTSSLTPHAKELFTNAAHMLRDKTMQHNLLGTASFVLQDGRSGQLWDAESELRLGDVVSILPSLQHPYVLRPVQEGERVRFISRATLHECPNGFSEEASQRYSKSFAAAFEGDVPELEVIQLRII